MKVRVRIALVLVVMSLVGWFTPSVHESVAKLLSYSACDTSVSFALGSLDEKFNVTKKRAEDDIDEAAAIWNQAYGKSIFTHASASAVVKINFIYDERTALRAQIGTLQNQLDKKNTTLEQQINAYKTDASVFEKKINAFNAKVHALNEAGGVSQEEYDKIIAEQNTLNAEGDVLNKRATDLSLGTKNYNANVENLNQNVTQFNEEISEKPEEGLYDADDHTITIYFAENHKELVHTLAHEFGHALEMVHTYDKKDLMYPSATSTLSLSEKDKEQLTYVCRQQSLPLHWLELYRDWVHKMVRLYESQKQG